MEVAHLHPERRRGEDRRRRPSRLERTRLGQVKSMIRAETVSRREAIMELERLVREQQLEIDRLNQRLHLEPLPPLDDGS